MSAPYVVAAAFGYGRHTPFPLGLCSLEVYPISFCEWATKAVKAGWSVRCELSNGQVIFMRRRRIRLHQRVQDKTNGRRGVVVDFTDEGRPIVCWDDGEVRSRDAADLEAALCDQ